MKRLILVSLLVWGGCAATSSRPVQPQALETDPGWTTVRGVPLVEQRGEFDCGAAAAAMVLGFWGQPTSVDQVWSAASVKRGHGVPAGWLRNHLRRRGLEAYLFRGTLTDLYNEVEAGHPVIVGVAQGSGRKAVTHYQVVVGLNSQRNQVVMLDPARGMRQAAINDFLTEWSRTRHLMVAAFPPEKKT